jgi:hypothetical protein
VTKNNEIKFTKEYFTEIEKDPKKIQLRRNLLKYEKDLFEIRTDISDVKDKQSSLEHDLEEKLQNLVE